MVYICGRKAMWIMKRYIAVFLCAIMALFVLSACTDNTVETNIQEAALSATSVSMQLGGSVELSVLNYIGDVKWSSSDTTVAKVSQEGRVDAVAIGSVAISATLDDGSTMTCVAEIKPGQSSIQSIKVTSLYSDTNDITVNYESDNRVSLKASCYPEVNEMLTWTSSDEMLATVDQSGVVTVYGNGIVEIKATALNGVEGRCKVRIKNAPANVKPAVVPDANEDIPVIEDDKDDSDTASKFTSPVPVTSPSAKTSVIVSDKNVYLNVGESFTLTYAVGNTNADDVTWMSSDKAVAIVSKGRIVAIGEGRAVVSAVTGDGAVASCSVAVGKEEIEIMKKEVSEKKK